MKSLIREWLEGTHSTFVPAKVSLVMIVLRFIKHHAGLSMGS